MFDEPTYISLLYKNNMKISERIVPDKDLFKKLSLKDKDATFKLESGQMIITLEDVIFIKISNMISLLDMGDILPQKRNFDSISNQKTVDLEIFFENGSVEYIKNIKYFDDINLKLRPKVNIYSHLSNLDREDFYFNLKNVIYIKILDVESSMDISRIIT